MQTQKVVRLHDVPELVAGAFVRDKNCRVAVLATHARTEDMDVILATPDMGVTIVNEMFGERDMLSHMTFIMNETMYALVLPMNRSVRHYLPMFFKVEVGGRTSQQFRLTRMTAVPHDIQPEKADAVTRRMATKWEQSMGLVPMGYARPEDAWNWQDRLANVVLETRQHGYIEFRLNEVFVMMDGRDQPDRTWPNFFAVADGSFGRDDTFRPVPMKLVEATDTVTAYVPHRTFDGW